MAVNVLLITLDQFRGDCLSAAGHPLVRTPNLDRLAGIGGAPRPPLQPGRAVRAGAGEPLHGHVPDEPSRGRQRHAARRPLRQRRPRRPVGPATTRCCSATPTRPSTRAWRTAPMTRAVDVRGRSCPASTCCSTCGSTTCRGWPGWRSSATPRAGGYEQVLATEGERPAEHSLAAFLTDHVVEWIERQDAAVVRPPQLLAPAPAVLRSRPLGAGLLAGRRRPADRARCRSATRCTTSRWPCRRRPRRRDEAGLRHMRAQYFGMISEVDDQLGRVWDVARANRPVGRHGDRRHVRPRRDARRPRSQGEARLLGAELPRAGHRPRPATPPETHGTVVDSFTENVDVDADDLRRDGRRRPGAVRRLSPHAVPARRGAAAVADGGALGVRLARPGDRQRRRTSGRGTARSSGVTSPCFATTSYAYVQFGNGSWLCFDLAADPTWRTEDDRPGRRAAARAGDADVAVPARRPHARRPGARATAAAAGRRCRPAGVRRLSAGRRARRHRPRADLGRPARGVEPRRQAQRRSVPRAVGTVLRRRA